MKDRYPVTPNLNQLKELAQTSEEIQTVPQTIYCPQCDCKRHQVVITYQDLQIRQCEGLRDRKHTLYFDPSGKFLWANEWQDQTQDWREGIDHARTEGVTPQTRAWETDRHPRFKGGRKKGGSGWTEYVNPEKDDY